MQADRNEPVGTRFGRVVVLDCSGRWCECRCDCGTFKRIRKFDLQAGKILSCGCLRRETAAASGNLTSNLSHGHVAGGKHSPTYTSWRHMVRRCTDPSSRSFKSYGARGVTICERWQTFSDFLADMGERPVGTELHRLDSDAHYEPGNCAWLPKAEHRALHHASTRHRAPVLP